MTDGDSSESVAQDVLSTDPRYTIGETARLAGVNQAAVRFWEHEGLIRPQRTRGGHRVYTSRDVERLRRIAWLRRVEKLNAAAVRRELGPPEDPANEGDSTLGTLGRRLRLLRDKRELSLRELAARAGLSASLLSNVERGRSGISLPNLRRLADALGTTVPDLQSLYRKRRNRLVRLSGRPRYEAEDSQLVIEDLITEPSALVAQLVRIAPKRERKASYTHPGEEFIHLLAGRLDWWINEDEHYTLEAGDSLHLSSSQMHRWRNGDDVPAMLLRVVLSASEVVADEPVVRRRGRRRLVVTDDPAKELYPYFDDFL